MVATPGFQLGKETTFELKLTGMEVIYGLCLAFISCIRAAFATLLVCSRGCMQTKIGR